MAQDMYRSAEDEYFKLRGQFDTGRLTQEQFDEKLRALMVQDDQGRYWMLGADSGKWYVYDGTAWVQQDPYPGASAPLAGAAIAAGALAGKPSSLPPASDGMPLPIASSPPPTPARSAPWVAILLIAGLVALAILGFVLFQNRDRLFVGQTLPTPITPVLPATITRAPSPTAIIAQAATQVATSAPTDAPPTTAAPQETGAALPTSESATALPPITVIVVTSEPPTPVPPTGIPPIPTAAPTVPPPPTAVPPTNPPPTVAPPTLTPSPTVPNAPPNVYVMDLTVDPPTPKRNQNANFTATFLNTTGETRTFPWLVLLYRAENGNGFGESSPQDISVPPGVSTFTISHIAVKGPGGCEPFFARAGWKISTFDKPIFPNTDGQPFQRSFDVCP